MESFLAQVEQRLRTKSLDELKSFVKKMALKTPIASQQDFLRELENKCIVIHETKNFKTQPQVTVNRIKRLLEKVPQYQIAAYYDDGGWYADDHFTIEDDDGFSAEYAECYEAAEFLLVEGHFAAAAEAFRLLFQIIDQFDAHNSNHDFGELHFDVLIDTGLLQMDIKKAKALRGYSFLMSAPTASDMCREFAGIFELCDDYNDEVMFREILNAGSMPVPNLELVLEQWIEFLYTQPPLKASHYVKEVAELREDIAIMTAYTQTVGVQEPTVYLDMCELLIVRGAPDEEIIQTAADGLARTPTTARKRTQLASLLADTAAKAGNQAQYVYAILERFYSNMSLSNYMPIFALASQEINQVAITALDSSLQQGDVLNDSHYYIIQVLNGNYDKVFDAIKTDTESLGWSNSVKGSLFPFFLGLTCGFADESLMIKQLIEESADLPSNLSIYQVLSQNMGLISREQEKRWMDWCDKEVCNRVDAIVSSKFRGSYYKAAQLLVALCEMKKYGKNIANQEAPNALLLDFMNKYPRHSAFKQEIKSALAKTKISL